MLTLRCKAAERYLCLLAEIQGLELPPASFPDRTISWFVFVVRLADSANRDRIQAALAARGIATGRYFAPTHLQPAWRNRPGARVSLPVTEAVAARTLALPLFNRITRQQQDEVANALANTLNS